MRNIMIITSDDLLFRSFRDLKYKVIEGESNVWIENDQGDFIELVRNDQLLDYYDDDEIKKIRGLIDGELIFYMVNFKNINFLKKILAEVAGKDNVVIDNDFDLIIRGSDFVEICKKNPDWDWAVNS
ncbi:hypothetical protein ACU9D5_003657 [Cronobacter dublinensis]|uniref:hypothetical protein n=2 Tax=Cronobacter dublinensis TaxID=413497 RepID=UPI001375CF22|nr:hypothetical protein [Cronobacter dublinensis]EGT4357610.1 hypothetical protein [Cronobacter dublinensis]ELY2735098.1 hypothetical protein [Cronobacter dublinensis]ELY2907104.1 hypothetical protein [Cronobacter dublinensis]ELY3772612.1 hypothetical protein [Cronobacter dublinensis]MDI6475642.1 hypothetical protein [Cronobacter dublinensis]